jgi:hypothetical protein
VNVRTVLGDRERVVEVLGCLRVDRERELLAEVYSAVDRDRRRVVGLEAAELAFLHQQALEHCFDPVCTAENAFDASSSATLADQGEVAGLGFA